MIKIKWSFVPINFNLEELLEKYPPQIKKFKKWKVYCLLNFLYSVPANNRDSIQDSGYVSLKARYLQTRVSDYKKYLEYLINTGVLQCDGQYIEGEKSYGYRYTTTYFNAESKVVEVPDPPRSGGTKEEKENIARTAAAKEDRPYIFYWYNQHKLEIDKDAALAYARQIRDEKLPNKQLWDDNKDGKKKHPETQYKAAKYNIEMFAAKNYNLTIDDKGYRLHSTLTNMQKDFRKFITYDGQSLVGIDIKNSQPYLVNQIVKEDFWANNSTVSISTLPSQYITTTTSQPTTITIQQRASAVEKEELVGYSQKTSSGRIYEYVIAEAAKMGYNLSRNKAKTMFLTVMYSQNRYMPWLKKVFVDLFPSISRLFVQIKRNDYKQLAYIMQNIESELILGYICSRIWEEGAHLVPVFTIHDSIATTEPYIDMVHYIMEDEPTKHIGVKPALSIEPWD